MLLGETGDKYCQCVENKILLGIFFPRGKVSDLFPQLFFREQVVQLANIRT
jgi:hypothetical protein